MYKAGDWVVLGEGGNGWSSRHKGVVAQIADIGPHLLGKLFCDNYDFYVYPNERIPSDAQIATPPSSGKASGGASSRILRMATREEIPVSYPDINDITSIILKM